MNIVLNEAATARLRELLQKEDDDAVVRVTETKTGCACKSKYVLRLSIDTADDDDVKAEINKLPFAISQDLIDQHGDKFAVALNEEGIFDVTVMQ